MLTTKFRIYYVNTLTTSVINVYYVEIDIFFAGEVCIPSLRYSALSVWTLGCARNIFRHSKCFKPVQYKVK